MVLSQSKSQETCKHLIEHPLFMNRSDKEDFTVCMYMPFRSELDITPCIEWCWEKGIKVLIPKAHRLQQTLTLHWINSYADVETGSWGIREPTAQAKEWTQGLPIDIMLVPGLAFDLDGGRLGYGGGYYDRFIRGLDRMSEHKAHRVSVAFQFQIVDQVPMETHDIRVDTLITENGMVK